MNARGVTVPLSEGFSEMWRKSERRAEKSVAGEDGIEGPEEWTIPFECDGSEA